MILSQIRSNFPALDREYNGKPAIYLDGPGGAQVCSQAITRMVDYMSAGGANLHGVFPTSVETEEMMLAARTHVAALLNTLPTEVAFGPNMTTLNLHISRALANTWHPGDEIVVTELDHRANVDPWLRAAQDKGVKVRWLEVDTDSLTLSLDALQDVINERTRVVAVGLAANSVGTITDVRAIADVAHQHGAIVVVDAVHAVPHICVDRNALGADVLLCSAYKFFGPHVGIAAIKSSLFEQLNVYKLQPAPTYFPDKLETGTQNHEGIAGVLGAIEFLVSLGEGNSQRDRLVDAMQRLEEHETSLANTVRSRLASLPRVTTYEAPANVRKTPTIAFRVEGIAPREVCQKLLEQGGLFVADGDFYATTLATKLGLDATGGFVRIGLAPYNTEDELNTLVRCVENLTLAPTK